MNHFLTLHKVTKVISLFSVLFFLKLNCIAQVSSYNFSQSNVAYSAIAGGTLHTNSTSDDDSNFNGINIGFTFKYNCIDFTQVSINSNGFIALGSSISNSYSSLTSGSSNNVIAALNHDLLAQTGSEIRSLTSGVAGSRITTIQWTNYRSYSAGVDNYNFQIKLYEGTNNVEICYGAFTQDGSNRTPQVGLIGSSNTDFKTLNVVSGTNTWATTTAGGSNAVTCDLRTALKPASGQKYTFSPQAMSFVSSNVVQSSTAAVTKCDFDKDIVCLQIVTSGGCLSPLVLTSLQLGVGGSSSGTLADVFNIHLYYTGATNSFNTTNEFVLGGTIPVGGSNTLVGTQTLVTGTNYFWIAYDVNSAATTANLIDAAVMQFTLSATTKTPTVTNPAGTRSINVCSAYPSTKALGLQHWVKSDVGVTGSPVSAWSDQSSGTSITGDMIQATSGNRPSFITNAVNFQPYLRFDGSNDIMASTNTFTGNTLYNSTNNTIFMVKNLKSGLVDYKWETDPTNATRMGFELNGSTQRFDFVDDNGGGKNVASTTNVTNVDVIVGGITDATTNNLRLNGNADAVNNHGGLTFLPGSGIVKPLYIGANDLANPLYCNVDIAEVMTFNVNLVGSELRRVESYLSIKYGITLGNNKGSGASMNYLASDGTQIWANQTGYHNNVIGIGRDNAAGNSGLHKLKSKSVISLNTSADILTIANGSNIGGAAFGSDKSFFITGNNAQALNASSASNADLPATIQTRLSRVWKGQETGTVGAISLKFDLASVTGTAAVAGNNNLGDIRLLVDADGVFASGATIVTTPGTNYTNATSDTIVFQFDFTGATGFYYTLGSVNKVTAPLPISLLDFTADCQSDAINLNWVTATETNNAYFQLRRSINGIDFETIATIQGHGTSTNQNNYSYKDVITSDAIMYYRLKQVDNNGEEHTYNVIEVNNDCSTLNDFNVISVYPNPSTENNVFFKTIVNQDETIAVKFIDALGRIYISKNIFIKKGTSETKLDVSDLSNGIYFIHFASTQLKNKVEKFIKE